MPRVFEFSIPVPNTALRLFNQFSLELETVIACLGLMGLSGNFALELGDTTGHLMKHPGIRVTNYMLGNRIEIAVRCRPPRDKSFTRYCLLVIRRLADVNVEYWTAEFRQRYKKIEIDDQVTLSKRCENPTCRQSSPSTKSSKHRTRPEVDAISQKPSDLSIKASHGRLCVSFTTSDRTATSFMASLLHDLAKKYIV